MIEEYPSDEVLDQIKNWSLIKKQDILGLLDFIENNWWTPECGFKLKGKKVLALKLHTLGWSGNEDIISALQDNYMFWILFWQKSVIGGHYYFKIPLECLKK